MPEMSDSDPPEPPFEANDEPVEKPEGNVRERVRQVLSSVTEPTKVTTIASMADCSAEGARTALREYAEMGVVVKTNDNPETYERNPAYFQFIRGHRLAQDHTPDELADKYIDRYFIHTTFVEQFEADSPEAVEVDEREDRDAFEEVMEWRSVLSELGEIREAYRQLTGEQLPSFEAYLDDRPALERLADERGTLDRAQTEFKRSGTILAEAQFDAAPSSLESIHANQREMMALLRSLSETMEAHLEEPHSNSR